MEYEERESEFDVEDEDRSVDQTGESLHDEEVEVNNKIGLGFDSDFMAKQAWLWW